MIRSDSGWKHSQPYRCTQQSDRVVVFEPGTPDEEIDAMVATLDEELGSGQTRYVTRRGTTADGGIVVAAHRFLDSSD